ncbi:MAG: FKBP-type peptidyl-prolyl cis-trans isomerase [Lentisphaeria bacterium]
MKKELTTEAQKTSYALGLDISTSLKRLPIEIDLDCFLSALNDVFNDQEIAMSQEEFQNTMEAFQAHLQTVAKERQNVAAGANRENGLQFLAANSTKDGVITTASGLQYQIIEKGEGNCPTADDTVTVHYTGTLIDGTTFDSSVERGQPATFPLKGVIKGWTEGLQLMATGSKFRFFIPSELAYGSQGAGQVIGPDCVLVFDVELIAIN